MLKKKIRSTLSRLGLVRASPPERWITQDYLDAYVAETERWQAENPGRPLRDWYAENKRRTSLSGQRVDSTLGATLRTGKFEESGRDEFDLLVKLGLQPDHTCVDYGCGTLRIGQHVVRYLKPGRYWGFEIDDEFIKVGGSLLSEADKAEKQPQLRVISAEAVAEAAQHRPEFLFSHKVMQHVHPDELSEYLSNVVDIITPAKGRAFVLNSKWLENETVRYKPMGWAHNLSTIREFARRRGVKVDVLHGKLRPLPLIGAGKAMRGDLRLSFS